MTGAVSLLRALEYIDSIGGISAVMQHEEELVEYFLTGWSELGEDFHLI